MHASVTQCCCGVCAGSQTESFWSPPTRSWKRWMQWGLSLNTKMQRLTLAGQTRCGRRPRMPQQFWFHTRAKCGWHGWATISLISSLQRVTCLIWVYLTDTDRRLTLDICLTYLSLLRCRLSLLDSVIIIQFRHMSSWFNYSSFIEQFKDSSFQTLSGLGLRRKTQCEVLWAVPGGHGSHHYPDMVTWCFERWWQVKSCNPMTLTLTLELTLTTVLLSFDHVALLMESLLLKVLDARLWSDTQNQKYVHVRIMQAQKIEQAFKHSLDHAFSLIFE